MTRHSPLESAQAVAALVRQHAAEGERTGCLHPEVVEALKQAGIYRLLLPQAYGGIEASLAEVQDVLEELAAADGATGWCAMIGAGSNAFSAWLDPAGAQELFGQDTHVVSASMFSPTGRAERVEGGYRVSGRWAFGSGCLQSQVILGNSVVTQEGEPQVLENGSPETIMTFFPAARVTIIPRWDVMGLKATASHDFEVEDVFVPEQHTLRLFSDPPRLDRPLYRLPFQMLLWLWMAPVPLGIARGALEAFTTFAQGHTRLGSKETLSDHPGTQSKFAQAYASFAAARAYVRHVSSQAWDHAVQGQSVAPQLVAEAGLASRHATLTAAHVTETLYELSGTSALRSDSTVQRAFRDAHAAMLHIAFGAAIDENSGRTLLKAQPAGLEA
ncbi:putative hydrolase (plasmid) [Deinococcus deserti VCD115]|uniref:Putative hydrolase n=2 Tax=Deinococcus TaxID=1298 RepID=C1D2G2_DEIDV|nr:putative hydrolase [Deinococcus deserti VCD115]